MIPLRASMFATRSMNIGPSLSTFIPVFAISALHAGDPDQAPAVSSPPM